ncbi:MAG: AzlC family ABC transporter permease [Clostridiaceae bacterium]|nr:AzlC family ABC transporter permease [Clostridiaceae bacterium]
MWRDGLAIGLGYLTVSFAFGLYATEHRFSPLVTVLISLTNLSSAGQFAGLNLILTGASLVELAATIFLINLRYFLMSLSLGQRLAPETNLLQRLIMGYGVTDEIFAVAVAQERVTFGGFMRLLILPVIGWTGGTALGLFMGEVLPASVRTAMGVALYGMFIAIVLPVARNSRPVLFVAIAAAVISCGMTFLPYLNVIPYGWRTIICTVIAAALGATFAPIPPQTPPQDTGQHSNSKKTSPTEAQREIGGKAL